MFKLDSVMHLTAAACSPLTEENSAGSDAFEGCSVHGLD